MTKTIIQNQIYRLAKIYTSKKVCLANMDFHNRVGRLQANCIRSKKLAK